MMPKQPKLSQNTQKQWHNFQKRFYDTWKVDNDVFIPRSDAITIEIYG